MAGLYPDVPGHRFPYDVDGTIVSLDPLGGGAFAVVDAAIINDESTADAIQLFPYESRTTATRKLAFAFPEPRTVNGIYVLYNGGMVNTGASRVDYSTDTTDGSDGTWTVGPTVPAAFQTRLIPEARTAILALAGMANVTGIRLVAVGNGAAYTTGDFYSVHLYGSINPAANPERLEFWDPTIDQLADKAALDFGNVPQGSIVDKTFRLKNLSATKTASSIVVSANNAADPSAVMVEGLTFSLAGGAFAASLNIGNLLPGATSGLITARRIVPADQVATARWARVTAIPATFVA